MKILDLLQLRYFKVVAEMEHMTKAALTLHISQPALSKMIINLENELGAQMFDRQGRQIRLNDAGKAFLRRVNRIFQELENGKREVANISEMAQQEISLTVTGVKLFADLFREFSIKHPDVIFKQHFSSKSKTRYMVENGQVDFCISSPPIYGSGLKTTILITDEIFLAIPAHHPLAKYNSIDITELKHHLFVSLKEGHGFRNLTDKICLQFGFTPKVIFETDIAESLIEFVNAGIGIAFVPSLAWIEGREMNLKRVRIHNPKFRRQIGLTWCENHYLSPVVIEFRQFVVEYYTKLGNK